MQILPYDFIVLYVQVSLQSYRRGYICIEKGKWLDRQDRGMKPADAPQRSSHPEL